MKFKGAFWPIMLILAGAVIILNTVFNFHIRLTKLIFAVVLIYMGYLILNGKRNEKSPAVFSEKNTNKDKWRNFSYVFGNGDVDLTDIIISGENINVKTEIVFGTGRVRLKRNVPAVIRIESIFASVNCMGENIVLGEKTFKTPYYIEGEPCLYLRVSTVFGSVYIDMTE